MNENSWVLRLFALLFLSENDFVWPCIHLFYARFRLKPMQVSKQIVFHGDEKKYL